jgi:2-polyprenyl-3-methyl-5-hydroxy-6-metoxy-1,4-benzoquinol methylase
MSLYSRYHALSDQRWLQLLAGPESSRNWISNMTERLFATGRYDPAFDDPELPRLPDAQIQKNFVGSEGRRALEEGLHFYQIIKEQCRALGRPLSPETRILDFGCGWGRIFRFFLKDVLAENLFGVDVDSEIIEICKQTIREGRFETVPSRPPTSLADESFDVIYAYSVFSHLSENVHLQWVEEFARLLAKGGLVFATTQKRSFIEYCNSLTDDQIVTEWHRSLSTSFRPMAAALANYDEGKFVYSPTGGGGVRDASFYGEAAVSERYVDLHWPSRLAKRVFDQETLPQALIIGQKA